MPTKEKNQNTEKRLEHTVNPGIILSLQDFLYRHPLYEWLDPSDENRRIRLLVIGFGKESCGRDFSDLCLQLGQMRDYVLEICAYSADPEKDSREYLEARPDLPRFVNVNGSLAGDARSYGALEVLPLNVIGSEPDILAVLEGAQMRNTPYDYIFIDDGEDELNRYLAQMADACKAGKRAQCPVCYVRRLQDNTDSKAEKSTLLFPVPMDKEALARHTSLSDADPLELEREAFRAHLSWYGSLNFDIQEEYTKFFSDPDPYNYLSSRAYALSIRYKLYSVGIVFAEEFHFPNPGRFQIAESEEMAAEIYSVMILGDTDRRAFRQLVTLEHRRWILFLVTQGWTAPRDKDGDLDLQQCVDLQKVKNEERRTHPCLVFSTDAAPLDEERYQRNHHARWDEREIDPDLDELDAMSVRLHQCFRKEADQIIAGDPLNSEMVKDLQDKIHDMGEPVELAWRQFLYCLSNILKGNIPYTRQYDGYRRKFTDTLPFSLDDTAEDAVYIAVRLAEIDRAFFPVREANLYRNYKSYDNALVENIPYILTWPLLPKITMAFEDARYDMGRNEKVFANVAAATVLSPAEIEYLYCCDAYTDPDQLCSKLLAVRNYWRKRGICCQITFTAVFPETLAAEKKDQIAEALSRAQEACERDAGKIAVFIPDLSVCRDFSAASEFFLQHVEEKRPTFYDGSTRLFSSPRAEALFQVGLRKLNLPYFEFDPRKKVFTVRDSCDYLKYAIDRSFLRINDMFALMNAEINFKHFSRSGQSPDFPENFEELWRIYLGDYCGGQYRRSAGAWDTLCESINRNTCPELSARGVNTRSENVRELLQTLEAEQFIRSLTFGERNAYADFEFKSSKIKALFEKSGEILEIYAYYDIMKTGYFDDVAISYTFDWDRGNVNNELDLVLTKGFRSMIIECKAVASLKQGYYYKLQSIAQTFGIGTRMVLICSRKADGMTREEESLNARGNQLNIATISDRDQITAIGETLKELMEERE